MPATATTARRLFDVTVAVAAAVVVLVSLADWRHDRPHADGHAVVALLVAGVLVAAGTMALRTTIPGVMAPVLAGVALAVLVTGHVGDLSQTLPIWALGVAAAYRLAVGPYLAALARAAVPVAAGAALLAVADAVDLGQAPYDAALAGLIAYLLVVAALEAIRDALGQRTIRPVGEVAVAMGLGVAYTAGLLAVADSLDELGQRPWRVAITAAVAVAVAGGATWLARLDADRRTASVLAEAAGTAPWPAGESDQILGRLVARHVHDATVSMAGGPAEAPAYSEMLRPGAFLVVRPEPGAFPLSDGAVDLVAGLADLVRGPHAHAASEQRADAAVDRVTGLWLFEPWRAALADLSSNRPGGERIGVVFLDLDDVKQLNAAYGEILGDEVLAAIGQRLLTRLPGWIFCRFGGAEFVGLVRHVRNDQHLGEQCRILGSILSEPITADGVLLTTAGSIGRTLSPHRSDDPDTLVGRAERDLRERQALQVAPPRLTENDMVQRLLAQGLDVAYQPVFDTATGDLTGWEALLRGRLPIFGALNPEHVVDSAARTGMLDAVMRQVAEQALTTATVASLRLGRAMTITINLEPEQVRAESQLLRWLVDRVANAPVRLLVEVTERGKDDAWSSEQDEVVAWLRGNGIGIVVDDYGSGASRLRLLVRDWTWIKLDRGFLLLGDRGLILLRHTVAMLHELGSTVLLEGIETPEQLQLARSLGIELVQGHLLGRPASAADLLAGLGQPPGVVPETR